MHWISHVCLRCFFNGKEMMEFTPLQNEILRAVFKQMDEELGIKPLTEEQIKAFNLKLEELHETNQQV
jgi:low affinity Fe/Cu permease